MVFHPRIFPVLGVAPPRKIGFPTRNRGKTLCHVLKHALEQLSRGAEFCGRGGLRLNKPLKIWKIGHLAKIPIFDPPSPRSTQNPVPRTFWAVTRREVVKIAQIKIFWKIQTISFLLTYSTLAGRRFRRRNVGSKFGSHLVVFGRADAFFQNRYDAF